MHFRLYCRSWDNESVVYNSGSGNTHLLDPVAVEALKTLEKQSATLPELLNMVAASLRIKPNAELASYLEKLLPRLEKLELVERAQN